MMGAVWLSLLSVILLVWYPLNFAAELLKTLPSIGMRGPVAARRALARIALFAVAFTAVQSLYWSVLPGDTKPGDELPLALFAIAHSAAWLVYLHRHSRLT
jgi:hypothetical protein